MRGLVPVSVGGDMLHDGVTLSEIAPTHIGERNMLADPLTKYLTFQVWRRHMHYVHNTPGEPPAHPAA